MPRAVIREDSYQCPECKHWYGEHMNTRLLSRHKEPGGDTYTLCHGSLVSLGGLPHQKGGTTVAPLHPPEQDALFPLSVDLLG